MITNLENLHIIGFRRTTYYLIVDRYQLIYDWCVLVYISSFSTSNLQKLLMKVLCEKS